MKRLLAALAAVLISSSSLHAWTQTFVDNELVWEFEETIITQCDPFLCSIEKRITSVTTIRVPDGRLTKGSCVGEFIAVCQEAVPFMWVDGRVRHFADGRSEWVALELTPQ